MLTKLIGRTGDVAGRDFVVPEDFSVLRVGAGSANEICIRSDGVSREHARILKRQDGCWIEDAGSRNGTFVNGQRLKSERLRHLDVITLARHVDLIFVQVEGEATPAKKPAVTPWLEFLNGPTAGASVEVPMGETVLGRGAACQLRISNPAVGKAHAKIVRTDGQLTIEDLRSANKTFVNDQPVGISVLKSGDRISIAGVVQLRVLLMDENGKTVDGSAVPASYGGPSYDQEWRTRLVWSPSERVEIERNAAKVLQMMDRPAPQERSAAPPRPNTPVRPVPPPVTVVHWPSSAPPPQVPADARKAGKETLRAVELTGGPEGTVSLAAGQHTVGRRGAADVRLGEGDREGSRIHAVLTVSAEEAVVDDRSVNGTYVNGARITSPRRLRDGDQIRCGGTTFTVHLVH